MRRDEPCQPSQGPGRGRMQGFRLSWGPSSRAGVSMRPGSPGPQPSSRCGNCQKLPFAPQTGKKARIGRAACGLHGGGNGAPVCHESKGKAAARESGLVATVKRRMFAGLRGSDVASGPAAQRGLYGCPRRVRVRTALFIMQGERKGARRRGGWREKGREKEREKQRTEGRHRAQHPSAGEDHWPQKNAPDCRCSLSSALPSPSLPSPSSLTHSRFVFRFYQPIALPSRGKRNSHVKTEPRLPRKASQRPLPRRGSRCNGAWTAARSLGRGQADFIPLNLICWAQKAANEQPASSESSIPLSKSSYQIGLKTA